MSLALYTYRDVATAVAAVVPVGGRVDATPEAVTVYDSSERMAATRLEVSRVLGERLRGSTVALDSTPHHERTLALVFEEVEPTAQLTLPAVVRPLWHDALKRPRELPPPLPSGAPAICSFYSYKGGVGRTTVLVATLGELLKRRIHERVLVVDADLEAPGLTWNIPLPVDSFSLLDLLSMVHDANDWKTEVMPLAIDRIRRNRQTIELPEGLASFDFLPAYRTADQIFSHPVTIEQVIRTRGRGHVVADVLATLGQGLGCVAVLVDLRAGVTEFSSPLLLDPRIQTVLVTSCSAQSINGTLTVLERLKVRAARETAPEIVINMIPPALSDDVRAAVASRLAATVPYPAQDPTEDALRRAPLAADFAQELLYSDDVQDLLGGRISGTDLGKKVAPALAELMVPAPEAEASPVRAGASLRTVAEEARKLEFAEGNSREGLLSTPSLTALVDTFTTALPAAVLLGSKGAGKTFAWGQMVIAGRWGPFARAVAPQFQSGPPHPSAGAFIFPLLAPQNVSSELSKKIMEAEREVYAALRTARTPMSHVDLRAALNRAPSDDDARQWIAWIRSRLGLEVTASPSLAELSAELSDRNVPIVLAVDGLEDAFQPDPQTGLTADQARILRVLLQDLTLTVRDRSSTHLGLISVVRRDLAESAIRQNFGQFEALFARFALTWSPTEALRLVAWLLNRVGLAVIEAERIPWAPYDELRSGLKSFWGERLGSLRSREAYTDRWVIAALSDFQGRLQPRDVVRLIRFAAEIASEGDRLTPQALRQSLARCSEQKVKELEMEIHALAPIFSRFARAAKERRIIPFRAEDFELTPEELLFLEKQGIVTEVEQGELYMPEIVRYGLGFTMKEGRRAKVLALYRPAQAK